MSCLPYFMQAPPMGFKKERVQRMQKMKRRQETSETGEPETNHPASTTSRATQELRSSRKHTSKHFVQESGPCWEETFGVRLRVTLTYRADCTQPTQEGGGHTKPPQRKLQPSRPYAPQLPRKKTEHRLKSGRSSHFVLKHLQKSRRTSVTGHRPYASHNCHITHSHGEPKNESR
jgi:hypothetical protein